MKALKTFGIAICAFLAFCVVVAIFDDNDSSSENKTEPQQSEQTEQKQEQEAEERQAREQKEEAERKAREQKEEAERKEAKKKEVAEAGYNRGYEHGFNGGSDVIGNPKTIHYTTRYGAPKSNEEKELFNIWKENWQKGFEEGNRARYSN